MSHKLLAFLPRMPRAKRDTLLPLSGAARGAVIGFRPMAVLCDERQAYKPERPASPSASQPLRLAPGPAARSTAVATAALAARPNSTAHHAQPGAGRFVLSGRLADVCAEIERSVRLEELHNRPHTV